MAWKLAQSSKRVLLVECGDYLERERDNWGTRAVFEEARYQVDETWYSSSGESFVPIGGTSHQAGTLRFGEDPATACWISRAGSTAWTTSGSPTRASSRRSGAVNPTLTIVANALRVADRIEARWR